MKQRYSIYKYGKLGRNTEASQIINDDPYPTSRIFLSFGTLLQSASFTIATFNLRFFLDKEDLWNNLRLIWRWRLWIGVLEPMKYWCKNRTLYKRTSGQFLVGLVVLTEGLHIYYMRCVHKRCGRFVKMPTSLRISNGGYCLVWFLWAYRNACTQDGGCKHRMEVNLTNPLKLMCWIISILRIVLCLAWESEIDIKNSFIRLVLAEISDKKCIRRLVWSFRTEYKLLSLQN